MIKANAKAPGMGPTAEQRQSLDYGTAGANTVIDMLDDN